MKSFYMPPTIPDGLLLSYRSEVHRDAGGDTTCGKPIVPGRAAPVSHIQAVVFKLALCCVCYPDHHRHHAAAAGAAAMDAR